MTTITNVQAVAILHLAKSQAADADLLCSTSSFANHPELAKLLQSSSAAVVKSITECFEPLQKDDFRKNFLVIAKGFNGEFRSLLHQCLEEDCIALDEHNERCQKNKSIEEKIIALIKQLRQASNKEDLSSE